MREAFRSGRLRLLAAELDAEEALGNIKGYNSLSASDKLQFMLPYIHTTLLIDELTKLQHEETGGKVKIFEKSGMRKDRYSSLSYNYYVATQLESKMSKRYSINAQNTEAFIIKPPNYAGKAVNKTIGRNSKDRWY